MKVFSGSSNKPLAEEIAKELGIKVSPIEIHVFPDKERRIRIENNVVDQDSVVIQSTNTPADTNYMELFFIIDGLKRSGAKTVTAVVPYLGYQRQDHVFRDGEAVSLEVVIRHIESQGVNNFITFDLHSIKIPELFHIPVFHLSALPLFSEIIKKQIPSLSSQKDSEILVSPDMGGIRRIKILSEMLGNIPYAYVCKERNLETGEVSADQITGLPEGKVKKAFIVDDMISSGKTIIAAANLLKKNGVEDIEVFVTHAIFSNQAPRLLEDSIVKKVYVTDAVYIPEEKKFPKLKIISVAKIIVDQLKKI